MAMAALGTDGSGGEGNGGGTGRRRTNHAATRRRTSGRKLDQKTIDRFPTNVVNKGTSEENCCICMDEMKAGSVCRRLPCFHSFHQECIDGWLRRNASCPICKRDPTT
mmetsp:Transcript_6388/g.8873  ORF Transcript_6388/g.8873 Transcript_6388/m.8873 type:complete len:108 (+) Transcript_6388:54-377(+)